MFGPKLGNFQALKTVEEGNMKLYDFIVGRSWNLSGDNEMGEHKM